jgi:pimeloyl-ACP methyl ester carboxylesterase
MAKIVVNGVQIHYQTKGTGPDVILIHGVTSSLAMWYTKVFPALTSQYRVTAYDLRGHGLSEITPNGYTSDDMVRDLVGLMDHLGIQSARIVGHSYGGAIGLHLALLHPQRVDGVVVLDSGLACLRHMRTIKEWQGWKRFRRQLEKFGISYDRFLQLDSKQDVSEVFRTSFRVPIQFGFRKGASRASPRFLKLINETTIGWEFREIAGLTEDRLPEIVAPVLALYGETSPYFKVAAHLSTTLPNCRYETLAEDGHFYLLREPGTALDRISGFIADPMGYVRSDSHAADVKVPEPASPKGLLGLFSK